MTTTTPPAIGDRVTEPGHVQYGDLLLGPGTPYRWKTLTGWEELPAVDSGTVNRSDAHGAYPGRLLAQPRTIGLEDLVIRARVEALGATVRALSSATGIVEAELPLVVHLDERGPLLAYARVVRRTVPVSLGYSVGTITGAAIQFEASDPRRYTLAEQCAATGLPAPGPAWSLDAVGACPPPCGGTGGFSAENSGDAPTHPVVTFRGPIDTPSLTNTATGAVLSYDFVLDADDTLTVDTYAGTVTLNGTDNRLHTASPASVPEHSFTLAPGPNPLAFRSTPATPDPRASATLRWRSAHW